jgi:ubiquinone/menaquinone biosynthesis C-methylase UbiE
MDFSQFMLFSNTCQIKAQWSALELPFNDKSFDVVFCSNLLHHLAAPLIAVKEMARVSKSYVIAQCDPHLFIALLAVIQ